MKGFLTLLGRISVTTLALLVAGGVTWQLWVYYMDEPWTRDGRVRADVVGVAPDVSGLVSQVLVRDNQPVKKGQIIFRIDRARFELALQQAQADVAGRKAALVEAVREANRYHALNDLSVSQERQQQADAAQQQAAAAYQRAVADRDVAELNLQRTEVVAPVNGIITNFDLEPGNYVSTGHAVTALVDTDSLRVEGYFEETKLHAIHVGAPADVWLMGRQTVLHGHVESVSAGIEDRERSASGNLLANVNPTFSWVRLAQRVPVRVRLDAVPADLHLLPGRTATVSIEPIGGAVEPTPSALLSGLFEHREAAPAALRKHAPAWEVKPVEAAAGGLSQPRS
ncbi:MAG: efflux transporter periplasmic adaptor subunit [Rhodospirillales bacterium 20-64-7]|nr:MAG: efflux transporter periplasmic adaptor subunit [Rhodospirillales bacterium 20-64-7]HQT76596.1 efflux RND transporter periplasmic adaptor subunit [Rhodopila sp.]